MGKKKGKEENSKVWRSRKRSAKDVNLRTIFGHSTIKLGFPVAQRLKRLPASACNSGDLGSILGLGRSPGEGNGNPLQYSCLENSMDGGAWWAIVHGLTKSQTRQNGGKYSKLLC